jgi:hypothetical protein
VQLAIANLTKTYANGVTALNGISLNIGEGMYGLLDQMAQASPHSCDDRHVAEADSEDSTVWTTSTLKTRRGSAYSWLLRNSDCIRS